MSDPAAQDVIRGLVLADPRTAEFTDAEREAVIAALTGAAQVVVERVKAITELCKSSTDGMVPAGAVLEALNGGPVA